MRYARTRLVPLPNRHCILPHSIPINPNQKSPNPCPITAKNGKRPAALIGALEFEDGRFWKGYDFDLLNSLHEQGLISQPLGKAKSAYLTPEGLEKAKALAEEMFGGESDL